MDVYSIIERIRPHVVALLIGVVGLVFVVIGLFILALPKKEVTPEIVFQPAEQSVSNAPPKQITVDIEGGVVNPGVYTLPDGARMQDAIMAAGGMSEAANKQAVAKTINLAAKLTDGAKIYIPLEGELLAVIEGGSGSVAGSGVINLNAANAKDLDSLPGIGEVTAQKIISGRPYASVDELLSKKIVSKKVFDQIKEKVSVY